ncbi:MAG: efflux transporter outer membrane subunit [Methylomonas sp.]
MKRTALFLCGAALLGACTVGPDYQRPEITLPAKWDHADAAGQSAPYQAEWWKTFNDPMLDQLIAEAAASNLDLQQAAARIRDARAQQTMAVAAALPAIDSRSNLSRRSNNISSGSNSSAIGTAGTSGGTGTTGGGFGIGNQIINIFQAGFDAQWELDIFGGIRRGIEAADATVDAEIENRRDVLVSLQGEVARQYIQLRANQQQLRVTQSNLKTQMETLELTQIRNLAGLASALEVAQQQALAATTEAQLPNYEAAIQLAIHAIGVLLGQEPEALTASLETDKPLPAGNPAIGNLPSELLRRRPDIRRSERQLAAATAQIGVATAELYPKFNLAAFLGVQNTRITDISPLGKSWSAAASISMPIFNWGKLQANIRSKEAQQEELLLSYRSTILTALREVEDSLIAYSRESQRKQSLAESVDANRLALELANERYQKGLTGFLDVLISQRTLLQAQNELIASQSQSNQHLIALYKALGGGWENL